MMNYKDILSIIGIIVLIVIAIIIQTFYEVNHFYSEVVTIPNLMNKNDSYLYNMYSKIKNNKSFLCVSVPAKISRPSGRTIYVFDEYGLLIDSTIDDGEHQNFQKKWRIDSSTLLYSFDRLIYENNKEKKSSKKVIECDNDTNHDMDQKGRQKWEKIIWGE